MAEHWHAALAAGITTCAIPLVAAFIVGTGDYLARRRRRAAERE